MSYQKRVLLWSSHQHEGPDRRIIPAAVAGGFTGAVETHGGENNGAAQARFCPATAKYRNLQGLSWMDDVKSFGAFHSGHSADPVIGGGAAGKVNLHDYVHGGPNTRLEHVHVLDCAGFDTLKIYWTGKCLAYEGLSISDANVLALSTGALVNQMMLDTMCVAAAGMPAIDSSDSMYALPKLMRLNENDSLATEGAPGAVSSRPTFTCTVNDTLNISFGLQNNDIVRAFTTNTLPTGMAVDTRYFVVQATTTTIKVSLSSGGAPVAITGGTGVGVHTLEVPAKYPGSGRRRGIPMAFGGTETQINWEPDLWIAGGEPLWSQWRGGKYPGTDNWLMYDQIRPALSFEGNNFNTMQNQSGGAPGMLQWGKVYKDAADIMKSYKWTQAGDRLENSMWVGYPNRTYQHTSAQTSGPAIYNNQGGPPLSISGLARIALVIGSIRLSWHGEGLNGGVTWTQAGRADPASGSTYLASSPVGPAVAPRQHVSGSIWAVLSSNTGPS